MPSKALDQAFGRKAILRRLRATELVEGVKPILRLLVEWSERYGKEGKIWEFPRPTMLDTSDKSK